MLLETECAGSRGDDGTGIAAVGGRAVGLCTHIGMATREHYLAEFDNEGVS